MILLWKSRLTKSLVEFSYLEFHTLPKYISGCSKGLLREEEVVTKTTPAQVVSLPARFSLTGSEHSKQSKILATGSINKAKQWTRFRVHPGSPVRSKKDRIRDRAGGKAARQVQSLSRRQDQRQLEVDTPRYTSGSDQGLTWRGQQRPMGKECGWKSCHESQEY